MRRRLGRGMAPALRAEFHRAQAAAEPVYAAYADSAPDPLPDERLIDFRRRLLEPLRRHSATWNGVSLDSADEGTLQVAERQILSEALAARSDAANFQPGELREVKELDSAGRQITRWVGDPMAVWGPFMQPYRVVTRLGGK